MMTGAIALLLPSLAFRVGDAGMDGVTDVALDKAGNIVIAGYTQDAHDDEKSRRIVPSGLDGFVSKCTPEGKVIWSVAFGGRLTDVVRSLAIDKEGNVIVAGYIEMAGTLQDFELTAAGGKDQLLAKFDPEGKCLWAKTFGESGNDEINQVAVAANGDLFVAGYQSPLPDSNKATSAFIARISPSGKPLWNRSWGSGSLDAATAIVSDGENLYFAGYAGNTIDFLKQKIVAAGQEGFVGELDPTNGEVLWVRGLGGKGNDRVARGGLAIDAKGQLCIIGSFEGSADIGGKTLKSAGMSDIFFGKLSSKGGKATWARGFGGKDVDTPGRIRPSLDGDLYVTGSFRQSVDYSDTHAIFLEALSKDGDAFLARYTVAGDFRWVRTYGSTVANDKASGLPEEELSDPAQPYYSMAQGIAVDGSGVLAVGRFFGNAPFVPGYGLISAGLSDGFVVRLNLDGF